MTRSILLALSLSLAAPAAQAAEPWKVLFDGKSTDAWRGFRRDTFPSKGWVIEDGALKTVLGGDRCDLMTKDRYKDFELELEWRLTPGGNGGLFYDVAETDNEAYFTGPEIQILDDAGHADGKNPKRTAGSLYDMIAPVGKKLKPVGQYNQYRIVKKAGHVEHWVNGTKVVEYQLGSPELTKLIAASKFKDMPLFAKEGQGYIAIQHHGQEAWYRNIRIRPLSPVIAGSPAPHNVLTASEKRAGWRLLFDGKTTAGWRGFKKMEFPKEGWTVKDGAIVKLAKGTGDSRGAGDIVTVDTFDDFDLRFEWRVSPGANSGVKYLVTEERSGPIAHEYQVIDDDKHPDAKIGAHRQTAALYDAFPASGKVLQPVGEFNQSRILVKGNKVEHWLNGKKVLAYELDSEELKAAKAKSKFKDEAGWGSKLKGRILLQDHGDEVAFRDIKIFVGSPE
jgi:3-keto-disaccharide hydrolase